MRRHSLTDTIYVATITSYSGPELISVCKGATCNGQDTSGCGQTPATAPAGFGANGVAIDQETNQVYVTAIEDTSVRTIEGTKERVVDRRYDPFVKLMRRIAGHKQR